MEDFIRNVINEIPVVTFAGIGLLIAGAVVMVIAWTYLVIWEKFDLKAKFHEKIVDVLILASERLMLLSIPVINIPLWWNVMSNSLIYGGIYGAILVSMIGYIYRKWTTILVEDRND